MRNEPRRRGPRISIRPVGLLAAFSLAVLALVSIATPAMARSESKGFFSPTGTSFADPICQNSNHTAQAPGGLAASCVGPTPTKIVYSFGSLPIPAEATNIRYRLNFMGYSGSGGGTLMVRVFPTGQFSGAGVAVAMTPSLGGHSTGFSTFNHNWSPTTQVSVAMEWYAGSSVHWDEMGLTVWYDMPDVANVGISVSGPEQLLGGTEFSYSVTVTNHGPDVAKYVILTTLLPDGIATGYNVAGCTNSPNGLPNCTLGDMAKGTSKVVTVHAYAMLSATGPKTATFFASTGSDDPVTSNNGASHTVTVAGKRSLDVCKEWQDNGDGVSESPRDFVIRVSPPNGASPIDTTVTVGEGGTECVPVSTVDAAVSVAEVGQGGFAEAPGYPQWRLGSSTGQGAVSVPVNVDRVTFVSRKLAAPTATATPTMIPTNTPQPTPTKTAVPTATPTKTTAPSATPTRTPSPVATATVAAPNTPAPVATVAPQQPQQPQPAATSTPTASTPPTGTVAPGGEDSERPEDEAAGLDEPAEGEEPDDSSNSAEPSGEHPGDEGGPGEDNEVEPSSEKPNEAAEAGSAGPSSSSNTVGLWIALGTGLAAFGSMALVAPAWLRRNRERDE